MYIQIQSIRNLILIGFLCCSPLLAFSQSEENLLGVWSNSQNTRKVEFYHLDDLYFGKVVWLSDDSKLKVGDVLFKNLKWNGRQFNGKVATSSRGDISCAISFTTKDQVKISGSMGVISKTAYWRRTN